MVSWALIGPGSFSKGFRELGDRSVQEFAEESLSPEDWLIMERLDISENILLRRGQDFHVARVFIRIT